MAKPLSFFGIPITIEFLYHLSNFKPFQVQMDQTEKLKQQSLSEFMKSQFHRKLAQSLLSVSVFSLFFFHSYWLSLLDYYFNFNFQSTLPFQLFNHAIDKNYIFLLCNGLLVFLARPGIISSSSKYNPSADESFKSYEDVPQSESIVLEPEAPLLEKEVALESAVMEGTQEKEEEEDDEEKWALITGGEEEEEENAAFVEKEDGEIEGSDDDLFVQDFEEEEEEEVELVEGNSVLSTEELNKRFDEFIRKKKEELRIEARQQLVLIKKN